MSRQGCAVQNELMHKHIQQQQKKLIKLQFFLFNSQNNDPIHVITIADEMRREKPPDYDQVTSSPPSYDDAIKLNPNALLKVSQPNSNIFLPGQPLINGATNNAFNISSELSTATRPSSSTSTSTSFPSNIISKLKSTSALTIENEKAEPPPYTSTPS